MKDRLTDERRYYYRVLRHFLSGEVKASYKDEEARALPPRVVDLLKALEQRDLPETRWTHS